MLIEIKTEAAYGYGGEVLLKKPRGIFDANKHDSYVYGVLDTVEVYKVFQKFTYADNRHISHYFNF